MGAAIPLLPYTPSSRKLGKIYFLYNMNILLSRITNIILYQLIQQHNCSKRKPPRSFKMETNLYGLDETEHRKIWTQRIETALYTFGMSRYTRTNTKDKRDSYRLHRGLIRQVNNQMHSRNEQRR